MNQPAAKTGFINKLRERLRHAALHLAPGAAVDDAFFGDLEAQLLQADVGIEATQQLLAHLRLHAREGRLRDTGALRAALSDEIVALLASVARPLVIDSGARPFVILAVGVNGVGKTTTVAKLAQRFQAAGRQVMLAATDTFRAGAIEQLQAWGARQNVPVIAQARGADPAAVAHDAWHAAQARGSDVLLVDTAGRLHTQGNLMEELRKIRKVLARLDAAAPHERLLVLDAGTGQNALRQIEQFHAAVEVSGLAVAKLDGTAKGGILIAAAQRFGIPIRYIGIGEQTADLEEFNAQIFAAALVGDARA